MVAFVTEMPHSSPKSLLQNYMKSIILRLCFYQMERFMKDRKKHLFGIAVTIPVIFSLFFTATAVADDGLPPTPTDAPISTPVVDPSIPTQDPTLVATEEPVATSAPTNVPEILNQLPDGTAVGVTVDNQPQPLVTQQASNVFNQYRDPIWCPAGALPDPGNGGCTGAYPDLFSLIDAIDNSLIPQPNQDGVIWIESGADSSASDIVIDGTVFPTWRNYQLTLQGGWDGGNLGNTPGTSTFSNFISVINWRNSVTINQLDMTGTTDTGLTVSTTKDINIQDVNSSGNAGLGAELDSGGAVTLTGVNTFNNNEDTGLYIQASGDINADGLTAKDNGIVSGFGNGAEFYSLSNVTLTGVNVFSGNNDSGLYIEANGNIDVNNIDAVKNGVGGFGSGAYLNSLGGPAFGVTVGGTNTFRNNTETGLYIESGGSVAVNNVTAGSNGGYGVELYTLTDVSVTGTNTFDANADSGLYIEADGNVDAQNLTSTSNGDMGVETYTLGTFTLTGNNVFDANSNSGLYIESSGDMDLQNITATRNGSSLGSGAELYSLGSVNISGTNIFDRNAASGLLIDAEVDINAQNISATGNGVGGVSGYGAEMYTNVGNVVMTGLNVFNSNLSSGLYIESGDGIDIKNVTANYNNGGAELYAQGNVTISGLNTFLSNTADGLSIASKGNVFVSNVLSANNAYSGIYLEAGGSSTIDCSQLKNNTFYGVEAQLPGLLTLLGVDLTGNGEEEYTVDNGSVALVSNQCYTYPLKEDDDDDSSEKSAPVIKIPAPINRLYDVDGKSIVLDCNFFSGTYITLEDGDGAFLPCPLSDTARLVQLNAIGLPAVLSESTQFVSSFNISIYKNGQYLTSLNTDGSVWYVTPGNDQSAGIQVYDWTGTEWQNSTELLTPFFTIFFVIPEELKNKDLAILYWDGANWIELPDVRTHLGDGLIVIDGKEFDNGYIEARVNFMGTFVLVQK
jgi:hypothetical protein